MKLASSSRALAPNSRVSLRATAADCKIAIVNLRAEASALAVLRLDTLAARLAKIEAQRASFIVRHRAFLSSSLVIVVARAQLVDEHARARDPHKRHRQQQAAASAVAVDECVSRIDERKFVSRGKRRKQARARSRVKSIVAVAALVVVFRLIHGQQTARMSTCSFDCKRKLN